MASGLSGRLFKMTPAGSVAILSSISTLNIELDQADDGNLYGTTTSGGSGYGSIFKVTPANQVVTIFSFNGTNGDRPSGMRKGMDGCFYGLTDGAVSHFSVPGVTTIFQFAPSNTVTTLYSVTNYSQFTGLPVQGHDGYLYGTIFEKSLIQPPFETGYLISFYRLSTNGNFQIIHNQSNAPAPAGDLIFGPDNSLYGVIGGSAQYTRNITNGSIFRVTTSGVFSNLFSFNGANGSDPQARLLLASDGNFYGTTFSGGISNRGTLFKISTNGELATLVHFTNDNGANPTAPLIEAEDGNLYGTTQSSTPSGPGTLFRLVQPPNISNLNVSNRTAALTWNTFPGGVYRLEYKTLLSNPTWTILQTITAVDRTISAFDAAPTDPQRAYRVVLLP
jgi:uncharacterized repeat protein (TIGR03803 family)